jgi:hypothetical protein
MKKYLLIGKSGQARSSFRRDPDTGKFIQFKIMRGGKVELTEEEMTFHIRRQAGFGILKIEEIEVEPQPEPEAKVEKPVVPWESPIQLDPIQLDEEEPEEKEKPASKKPRSRLKKAEGKDEETE